MNDSIVFILGMLIGAYAASLVCDKKEVSKKSKKRKKRGKTK